MLGGFARNTVVERYTIERELGSGAFGTVYAARDSHSGQLVALKQLSRLSPAALSCFKQEFRAVQGLNHPHIVRLDALIEHESGWLIAMEYVEGDDLLHYIKQSDNDPIFDEHRLRTSFCQLAEALAGLHAHGVLHRDLKPANIRVAPNGRVVLLDFGLVTAVASEAQSTHLGGAGTAAYMAPEQARGQVALTAAADWYAFGVCLYEALTGSLPFQMDAPLAVMFAKQGKLPDRPSERISSHLPADLEQLCMGLLAPTPQDRPGFEEVHRLLAGSGLMSPGGSIAAPELDVTEPFQGRETELARISAAHTRARSEGLRMLLVEAESGMGKSALVAEWLQQLKSREPTALVLKSQCYENEHSAFKAFDAGMEALARRLIKLAGKDGQLLLPAHSGLLPRLFPSLASVKALKNAPLNDLPADPSSALRCGLIALATLLKLLAASGPVVLVIDDLQWADPESFRLLRTLSEAVHAPRVLVLATVRPQSELDGEIAAELALLGTRMELERLPLAGLSKASCERLACNLLTGSVMAGWLDRITTESKGHPLFVSVLSRYAASHRPSESSELSLEAALKQKVKSLDQGARALVELLALAGAPCSLGLLSRTLSVDPEQLQKRTAELVSANLLRRLPRQQLACFHDLLRGVVVGSLGTERKRELHQALANALTGEPDHDVAMLAAHLEGAQQFQPALVAHHRAADGALALLAFGKAEHHYGRALALAAQTGAEPELVTTLRAQRGHALARGGHSARAAQQYLEACEQAAPAQRIELRVWAAQHLLQSAQVEAGLNAAREVLIELGVPLPNSEGAALARIAWDRMCLGVTGLTLAKGKPEISESERARLDAMWRLASPVSFVELLAGAALNTRHLRRSLSAGNHAHAARALAGEAMVVAMQQPGALERTRKLFERARALYDAEQNPALEAWTLMCEGSVAALHCEITPACQKLTQAEALLRTRCPEEPSLLTQARSPLASAWFQTSQFAAQIATLQRWLAEAADRDDRSAIASFEAHGFSLHFLLSDEPERVGPQVAEAMASLPRAPFSPIHMIEIGVHHAAALYRGGDAAWQYLEAERTRHDRAFLLKTGFGKSLLATSRFQAALSAYAAAGPGPLATQYLDAARTSYRVLRRSKHPFARLYAPVAEAQLALFAGETDTALALIRVAAREYARLGVGVAAAQLAYLEGLLVGGDAGREQRVQALALAAAQGWKNPRRFVAMGYPVIDWLEAKSG